MVAVGLSVAHSRVAVPPSMTTTFCGETSSRGGEGEAGESAGGGGGGGGGGGEVVVTQYGGDRCVQPVSGGAGVRWRYCTVGNGP